MFEKNLQMPEISIKIFISIEFQASTKCKEVAWTIKHYVSGGCGVPVLVVGPHKKPFLCVIPLPTEVPQELAESLAPTAKLRINEIMNPEK